MKLNHTVIPVVIAVLLLVGVPAYAVQAELRIPEKVDVNHTACQEIIRLGKKYGVEHVFPAEFEEGKASHDRLDIAVAVELVTERMAEKAVREGAQAVSRDDLEVLNQLREELRGEMILVETQSFQQRRAEYGTRLHALTRNITLSGGLTGVVQGSANARPRDHVDAVGRGDLIFKFTVGDGTIAVIDVEATGGDGLDARIPSFSLLNGVAGSTDDVRFREAWVEQSVRDDAFIFTIGKIDLSNYFDTNAVANDENSQFLSGAFVNSVVSGLPTIGPGIRVQARYNDMLLFGVGYGSGSGETSDLFDHGFGIAEMDYRVKFGEREGNYRLYGTLNGAAPVFENDELTSDKRSRTNAFGLGLSIDQQVTDHVTLFARYGWHDADAYTTVAAWSAGFQYAGIPGRDADVLGLAYGQVQANDAARQEKLAELYYRAQINQQISVSPHFQYLVNAAGSADTDDIFVAGLRTQVTF